MNYELWISPCHLACGGVKQVASEPVAEQQGVSWKHPSEELDHREYHQECHLHHRHCFSHPESEYGLGPKVHHPHHQDPFCFSSPFLWWMAGVLRVFFWVWSGAPSLEEASDADTRGGKAWLEEPPDKTEFQSFLHPSPIRSLRNGDIVTAGYE